MAQYSLAVGQSRLYFRLLQPRQNPTALNDNIFAGGLQNTYAFHRIGTLEFLYSLPEFPDRHKRKSFDKIMLRADHKLSLLERIDRQMVVGDIVQHEEYGSGILRSGWEGFLQVEFPSGTKDFTDKDDLCLLPGKLEKSWRLFPSDEIEKRYKEAIAAIRDVFRDDFINADEKYDGEPSNYIGRKEYEKEKIDFVRSWLKDNLPKSNAGSQQLPDAEQLHAIATVNGLVQVVARAGSGKTATLVIRAYFMMKHCRVAPSAMLLLAFNRKAANEIRRRILLLLEPRAEFSIRAEIEKRGKEVQAGRRADWGEIEAEAVDSVASTFQAALPHVMTFHALAYAIVHPEESLLYNGAEVESQGLSKTFQRVIDDFLQDADCKNRIRELMLAHFREDWDRIVEGRYDQTKDELLKYRRSLPRESIGGEYVKSYGEKVIADFLFEHDISYKYERNYWWGGLNYRPDFTIFKTSRSGVIIEYFGLAGDPDYDEMSIEKRRYWRSKPDWELIEFSPADFRANGAEGFIDQLKRTLREQGLVLNRLSEDEIWIRVRDRAIDRFTSAAVGFVGRCRKRSLSSRDLGSLIDAHEPLSLVESIFLDLVHDLYAAYLQRLVSTGEEDFDGLLQRAASAVSSGRTRFERKTGGGDLRKICYAFVDEFQDFSDLFYRLLQSVRQENPGIQLFCVGDDWQAINGFAGSDLRFFSDFERWIGKFKKLYISTNYRSSRSIVDVGNALMRGHGKPAVANSKEIGSVFLVDVAQFEPALIEKKRHPGDVITPIASRIVSKALTEGKEVVLLCRRNGMPWFINFQEHGQGGKGLFSYLELLRSFFSKAHAEDISISTVHKYKGLEKPVVIVMDAVARSYPLIHPDWAFSRILGDSPESIAREERRLLYVALTRAIDKLFIVTERQSFSPFIEEMAETMRLNKIDWGKFPAVKSKSMRLLVQIGNQEGRGTSPTYAIKDQLRASGYQWQNTGSTGWTKGFQADGFDISLIQREVWASAADGIEVRILDESDCVVARFVVDAGTWVCAFDNLVSVQAADDVA